MYTPNKPANEQEDDRSDWNQSFPEPQTIPTGWDVSELTTETVPYEMGSDSEG